MYDRFSLGRLLEDAGFTKVIALVAEEVIEKGLVGRCGFRRREIVMLGFGQGGMVALGVVPARAPLAAMAAMAQQALPAAVEATSL